MTERPIIFSAPMVLAIHRQENPKAQTRRPDKLGLSCDHTWPAKRVGMICPDCYAEHLKHCPYGVPGDRLWVKEAWRVGKGYDELPGSKFRSPTVHYEADGVRSPPGLIVGRYRHARFMPRWASRTNLEIRKVRVERLQDITEADVIAEGFARRPEVSADPEVHRDAARDWYIDLWDRLNAETGYGWKVNPWVWVVEFARVAR